MRIKTRIQLSIILSLILAVVVGSLFFLTAQSVNKVSKKIGIAVEIVKDVAELKILTDGYLLHPGDRSLMQWRSRYDSLMKHLTGGYFKSPDDKISVDQILKNLERIKTVFDEITIGLRKKQRPGKQESTIARARLNRLEGELLTKSQATVYLIFQLHQEMQAELVSTQQRATSMTFFFLLILTVLIVGISLWVNRSIARPIAKLEEDTQIIGTGNLDHKVGTTAKDEIGGLSRAFDKMTDNLKKTTASIVDLNREIDERKRTEKELEQHREHLEEIVRKRTTELDKRISEVEQLNSAMVNLMEDLRVSNENLELTTRQLSDANKELESFSYSVSHDLRAPLRAIDGFSQMLVKDYGDKLDEGGQHQLDVIQGSARQMGQLIDDLLAFSRLGRKGISMSEIDMGVLAQEVLEQLQLGETERTARLNIDTLPPANGDRAMIREVFVNLLSNAMKFTRPGEAPVTEVTGTVDENENVYSVKDKGVGFDMKYADKLFQVFQRLHSAEEYEGTGIGLALVQRIIHRHGGRVWAEGEVNKGATFYFTLPGKSDK